MGTTDNIRRRISSTKESLDAATDAVYRLELRSELLNLADMYNNLDDAQDAIADAMHGYFDYGDFGQEAEYDEGLKIAEIICRSLVNRGWVIIPSLPDLIAEDDYSFALIDEIKKREDAKIAKGKPDDKPCTILPEAVPELEKITLLNEESDG